MTSASDTAPGVTADAIDALLPQTQCGRCGYVACRPYAEAVAAGVADINRCPPGGDGCIAELAALLHRVPQPLADDLNPMPPMLAVIVEPRCIGCTLCIQACPVDAISGAARMMHTVLADVCTGCELCIPVCPVDCINMIPVSTTESVSEKRQAAQRAKRRFETRLARLARPDVRVLRRKGGSAAPAPEERRRKIIAAAMERARTRLDTRKA